VISDVHINKISWPYHADKLTLKIVDVYGASHLAKRILGRSEATFGMLLQEILVVPAGV